MFNAVHSKHVELLGDSYLPHHSGFARADVPPPSTHTEHCATLLVDGVDDMFLKVENEEGVSKVKDV